MNPVMDNDRIENALLLRYASGRTCSSLYQSKCSYLGLWLMKREVMVMLRDETNLRNMPSLHVKGKPS